MGPREPLTRRETEVLEAVGRRLTNPEIATELVVSLRTVESHIASLRRKLGVDSRAGLRAAAVPGVPRRTVTAPTDAFIGREDDLVTVRSALEAHRWVTLTGAVGCGKSRLAREALAGRRGLVLDVAVAGQDLVLALLAALHVQAADAEPVGTAGLALDAWAETLVLDNCDVRAEACLRMARDLLRATSRLVVVCTARGALGAPEEVVVPVAPLAGDPARARAAVAMFRARALAAGARAEELDEETIERICGHLDGLPLAIELAAARCGTLPPDELERLLAQGMRPLTGGPSRTGRHRTLAAAVDWSVHLLDAATRRDLVALCSLPGPVALADLERTLGAGSLQRTLELIDRSLAWTQRDSRGVVVTGVLRTVREQVLAEAAAEVLESAQDSWCTVVADDAARLAARARHDDGRAMHLAWRSLAGTLPWVIDRLAARQDRRAAALARDVGVLSEQFGPDAATSAAVARLLDQPTAVAAVPLTGLDLVGDALLFENVAAAAHLARAAAGRTAATPLERACVARLTGMVALHEGRAAEAVPALTAAESLSRAAGDGWRTANALHALAMASADAHQDEPGTWTLFEQAMAQYATAGDAMHVNNVRYMMCHHGVETGRRLHEALRWADQCVDYATETSNIHELAHAQLVRARLTYATGGAEADAHEDLRRAREVFACLGDARCLARALLALAARAPEDEALELLRSAWEAATRSRKRQLMAGAARPLAAALHRKGRTREAGLVLGGLAAVLGTRAALAAAPHDAPADWPTLIAEGVARARSHPET